MENKEIELITSSKLESYLQISGVAQNLTLEEQKNFLQIAMDFNLNPFKREIYCTSYGKGDYKKTSIIIGYEVYIKRAERTGQLDGWQVVTTGSVKNQDLKATITIYRKDRKFPFIHEVDYIEYVQYTFDKQTNNQRVNKMWSEKPVTMLKKVATAQGFRLCFSDELGGMPYDSSELPGNDEREIVITSQTPIIDKIITEETKQPVYKLQGLKDKIAASTKKGEALLAAVQNMKKGLDTNYPDCADYTECNDYLSKIADRLISEIEIEKAELDSKTQDIGDSQ